MRFNIVNYGKSTKKNLFTHILFTDTHSIKYELYAEFTLPIEYTVSIELHRYMIVDVNFIIFGKIQLIKNVNKYFAVI